MADHSRDAALRILPGLQYLARAAHDSGAGRASDWIVETIARIVEWSDGGGDEAATLRGSLARVLAEARHAGLAETARHLENTLLALEQERRR